MSEIGKKMTVGSDLEKSLIFQSLMRMREPLHVEIRGRELPGIVENFTDNNILVRITNPFNGNMEESCRAHFVFHNNYHYFTTRVYQKDPTHLTLAMPREIFKNLLRKHDRINVLNKVYMKFKIHIQKESSEFEQSSLLEERLLFQEMKKPRPAIDKMLKSIKNLVSEFAQNFQVKVFKGGEELGFDEQIVKDTRRIFLIYDTYEDSIEDKRFLEDEVLTVSGIYEYLLARGETEESASSKLLDLLQQKRNKRIFSECLVPMMLEGEVVGYIRLVNDADFHRSIKPSFAIRTARYSSILVSALLKYDYFTLESGKDFDIPIVNISAGGLLFKLNKPGLSSYLIINTGLQMSIRFPSRQIEVRGTIFRIDQERSEYGVKFEEINEIDMRYIDDVVHGKASL